MSWPVNSGIIKHQFNVLGEVIESAAPYRLCRPDNSLIISRPAAPIIIGSPNRSCCLAICFATCSGILFGQTPMLIWPGCFLQVDWDSPCRWCQSCGWGLV